MRPALARGQAPRGQAPRGQAPSEALPEPLELIDDLVRLRRWTSTDASALVAAWHDPGLVARLSVPEQRDIGSAERWIRGWEARRSAGLALDLVVCAIPDDTARGEVGISHFDRTRGAALIGWWLAEESRGKGLATRAVQLVTRWALHRTDLRSLVAEIDDDNLASLRLAERCGFVRIDDDDGGRTGRQVHVLRATTE